MQSNTEFTYSEGKKQDINFTLFAPSGSGGAILSEILDDYQSADGERMYDNTRSVKTNEYAGSPNCYRYYKYESHYIMNEFPEWSEQTILYGKDSSPLKFYKNCKIKSPKLYYIDVTGHEYLLKELVFMKKFVGGSLLANGIGMHLRTISNKEIDYKSETTIAKDDVTLKLLEHRLERISAEYGGILNIHSPVTQAVIINNNLDPSKITKHEIHTAMVSTYKMLTNAKPGHWTNTSEVEDYTDVHIIKYDDLINGRDTGTKLDDNKKQLKEYFERNEEILDELLSYLNI